MSEENNPSEVTFEELHLHPNLLKGIQALGFIRPTPVQAQAIPLILQGRDMIGCAQTGTGKTAAFVLPILHKLLEGKSGKHVRAMIVAPTRELALQSMDHLKALSKFVHLKGAAIFGGVPMNPQITALENGVDIISATPGRLLDHIYNGRIDFVDLQVLVLDEADRMLDMGFIPDIRKIISLLPPKRQNLMFSATMPKEILGLAHEFLDNPAMVQIGLRSAAAAGIRHAVYPVPRHLKTRLLLELLRGEEMESVLVFARTKRSADRLSHELVRQGVSATVIHGDRSQNERLDALDRFRYGDVQVMVATDIAARGIDVEEITHVINYDIPEAPEDYVHRIGRTARAEATGDAFSLMDQEEEPLIADIERALNRTLPRVTLPHFDYRQAAPPSRGGGRPGGGRSFAGRSQGRPQGRPHAAPVQGRPQGAPAQGRPRDGRPQGGRPHGGRSQGGRPQGERPQGGRPQGRRRGGPPHPGTQGALLQQQLAQAGRPPQQGPGDRRRPQR